MSDNMPNEVVINEKSMEILVAKFIPTSQYFERSFEMLNGKIEDFKDEQREFRKDVYKRFEQIDDRFKQIDKTIDDFKHDVDKRFEQVDKRFEQINDNISNLTLKIEQLTKAQEVTIRDYIIERDRHYDTKFNNLRMFNIATISLVAGVILKMAGILHI